MAEQPGFFDGEEQLKALSAAGDPLERLAQVVDFEMFRGDLERALSRSDRSKRCYGASGERTASSSLQQTDGVPHATAK